MKQYAFTVSGKQKPAGSKTAFRNRHSGKIVLVDSSGAEGKMWRTIVQDAAKQVIRHQMIGALRLEVTFYMARPKNHYRANGELKSAFLDVRPIGRPDTTKLLRALEDALTGIVWRDDAQVVEQYAQKIYADTYTTIVTITEL